MCLLAGWLALPAVAHEKYQIDTLMQPEPEGVRIQHRLVWHDVAAAIEELDEGGVLEFASEDDIARVRAHVETRFRLFGSEGELPVRWLGAQKEGDVLLVQQRLSGRLSGEMQIWHALLGEVFPLQVNRLYCARCNDGDELQLVFTANNLFLQDFRIAE